MRQLHAEVGGVDKADGSVVLFMCFCEQFSMAADLMRMILLTAIATD